MASNTYSQNGPQSLSELMKQVNPSPQQANLDEQSRASIAWAQANGDKEARHSTGVWLKAPTQKEDYPTLIVYIDSSVMLADFQTNHEIYAMRLQRIGFPVEKVEFRLSKYKKKQDSQRKTSEIPAQKPLVELSEEQLQALDDELQTIASPVLREKARKASIRLLQWDITKST